MFNQELFTFDGYECIGFDLDSTLVEYNELEIVTYCYRTLAEHLVSRFKYDAEDLLRPVSADIDFLQKGLVLDVVRGNIVNLADNGTILRACHGTRTLTLAEIEDIYGPDRIFEPGIEFCGSILQTSSCTFLTKICTLLDCFTLHILLLFVRVVDSIDKKNGKPLTNYSCWSDILETIDYVERSEADLSSSKFFATLKANPAKYIKKRSPKLLGWLDYLKELNKITFVITNSCYEYTEFVATYALDAEWKKYFDVIVYDSGKPTFFFEDELFISVGAKDVVPFSELKTGGSYRRGNWTGLYKLFTNLLNKEDPKCVYMGDNLIYDVYTPSKFGYCNTVAIVEALVPECEERSNAFFTSKTWGSIIFDSLYEKRTMWGYIIEAYSKVCIPNLEWFVNKDLWKKYEQLKQI